MKVNVSELQGAALDWAVAAALNAQYDEDRVVKICRHESTTPAWIERENSAGSAPQYHRFSPATDWALAGPIIEREKLSLTWLCDDTAYRANTQSTEFPLSPHPGIWQFGPTSLIAAMRCYVASKMGDEIEVPDELH